MTRLTHIITVAAFLTICHLQGMAQELITPPAGLTKERWELTYDDYRVLWYDKEYWDRSNVKSEVKTKSSFPPYESIIDLKREVVMVREGDDVYIKGIFEPYADAWIKGTVNGDRLIIRNNQIIDTDGPIYFHWGSSYYVDYFSPEWASYIYFEPEDNGVSFIMSDTADMITSGYDDIWHNAPAFWFDNDEVGDWMFGWKTYMQTTKESYGLGYPYVPYMINMRFTKIEDNEKRNSGK